MTAFGVKFDEMEHMVAMTPERVVYELERFSVKAYFAPEVLHSIQAKMYRDFPEHVAVEVVAMVAAWRQQRMLEVPANWWEHFKQRWFPGWALKRWPVLTKTYDAAVILPRVPVVRPEYHTVEFPVWKNRP